MAEPPLAFHASAPGDWINDPNGLVHDGDAFRLFAQHRADAPTFRQTGWARFSSPDLLRWTFDGSVIPPAGAEWAYSGCVERTPDGLEALHTAHVARSERQVCRTSSDGGLSWSVAEEMPELGSPALNRRDPYVFRDGDGWALLLAEPCDWSDWELQPPSRLRLYRSPDRRTWRDAGTIGPWRPAGIMWEVPVFARIDGHDVLFVSEVDRRAGGASCSVRAWIGTLTEEGFIRRLDQPEEGQLVDHGPDFYALMASTEDDWPLADRAFVGWLSNWQTARTMRWPGFHGGPISLPRVVSVDRFSVCVRPLEALSKHFTRSVSGVPVAGRGRLCSEGERLKLTLSAGPNAAYLDVNWRECSLEIGRMGDLPWQRRSGFAATARGPHRIEIYLDGPLIEFFLLDDGISASVALPSTDAPFEVSAQVDGHAVPLAWNVLE